VRCVYRSAYVSLCSAEKGLPEPRAPEPWFRKLALDVPYTAELVSTIIGLDDVTTVTLPVVAGTKKRKRATMATDAGASATKGKKPWICRRCGMSRAGHPTHYCSTDQAPRPFVDAPCPFPLPHDPPLPNGTLGLGLPHKLFFRGELDRNAFARLHACLVEKLTFASENALTPEERNFCKFAQSLPTRPDPATGKDVISFELWHAWVDLRLLTGAERQRAVKVALGRA
jgi:hypothetical protein